MPSTESPPRSNGPGGMHACLAIWKVQPLETVPDAALEFIHARLEILRNVTGTRHRHEGLRNGPFARRRPPHLGLQTGAALLPSGAPAERRIIEREVRRVGVGCEGDDLRHAVFRRRSQTGALHTRFGAMLQPQPARGPRKPALTCHCCLYAGKDDGLALFGEGRSKRPYVDCEGLSLSLAPAHSHVEKLTPFHGWALLRIWHETMGDDGQQRRVARRYLHRRQGGWVALSRPSREVDLEGTND